MPTVTVRIHAPLSMQMGLAEGGKRAVLEEALEPGARVRDLIAQLAGQHPAFGRVALAPETGRLARHVLLAVNGQPLSGPDAYEMPLKERDEIVLLLAVAGG